MILYFFSALAIIILITNLISDFIPLIPFLYGDHITFVMLTIVIFCIGYFGIKQKVIYPDIPDRTKVQYQKSSLKISDSDQRIQLLLRLMEQEKLYLNSKLSLRDLAGHMNLTENNLSQLINDGLGKNFYDFVNAYRVDAVKHKIIAPELNHLSLLGIALESGFNSKSSFNNIFKKYTGLTPSQYKKLNLPAK